MPALMIRTYRISALTVRFYTIMLMPRLLRAVFPATPALHNVMRPTLQRTKFAFAPLFFCRMKHTEPVSPQAKALQDQVKQLIDADGNVPPGIIAKIGRNLHQTQHHPIFLIRRRIEEYFKQHYPFFETFSNIPPVVSVKQNFDDLLFPADHPGRSHNDTYYLNKTTLLRTHTTAHQPELLRKGHKAFLVTGDVYRRDEIDARHYPAFHQTDGVRVFSKDELASAGATSDRAADDYVEADMRQTLEGLAGFLFGRSGLEMRWNSEYFPFVDRGAELEIKYSGGWLEVLGCGVIRRPILSASGFEPGGADRVGFRGWAFGLGLERLAMRLFDIPDVRLFWSTDPRFLSQFVTAADGTGSLEKIKFKPFSKYPACPKDISFWIDKPEAFHDNKFFEIVREAAGDIVENVELVDKFTHPATQRTSKCFRIIYRSMERNLTNEEVNEIQARVVEEIKIRLGVTLR